VADFYQVMLIPRPTVSASEVIAELDKAVDWFQVSDACYVLYTRLTADRWAGRLQKLCKPEGELLIAKMDPDDSHGWMPQQFWDWLARKTSKPSASRPERPVDSR
jgi:hypothetical protein